MQQPTQQRPVYQSLYCSIMVRCSAVSIKKMGIKGIKMSAIKNVPSVFCTTSTCCQQPSSERSDPDEPAEQAEADRPDQLSKEELRRPSGSGHRSTVSAGQTSDEAKLTSSDNIEQPQQELIDANDVLKALKAFAEENNKHRVRHVALCVITCRSRCYFFIACITSGVASMGHQI